MGRNELLAELRAIDAWDVEYYRSNIRDYGAQSSFRARQDRRHAIFDELRNVLTSEPSVMFTDSQAFDTYSATRSESFPQESRNQSLEPRTELDQLLEQATRETDSVKISELVQRILQLLDQADNGQNTPPGNSRNND